jgi:hypothetical protein
VFSGRCEPTRERGPLAPQDREGSDTVRISANLQTVSGRVVQTGTPRPRHEEKLDSVYAPVTPPAMDIERSDRTGPRGRFVICPR